MVQRKPVLFQESEEQLTASKLLDRAEQASLEQLREAIEYQKESGESEITLMASENRVHIGDPYLWDGSYSFAVGYANAYGMGVEAPDDGLGHGGLAAAGDGANAYADAYCTSGIIYGSCSSWAWTGFHIKYTGESKREAYIEVYGDYAGVLKAGPIGGSAGYRVRVSVYDYTLNSETDDDVEVADEEISNISYQEYSGSISAPLSVIFVPGHSYLIRIGIATSAEVQLSYANYESDFYSGGYGGQGVDFSYIYFDMP